MRRAERGRSERAGERVYCVIGAELAPRLHDELRAHFADDPAVEVIVERRGGERRGGERRAGSGEPPGGVERRLSPDRRGADRRASRPTAKGPELPDWAKAFESAISFLVRGPERERDPDDRDRALVVRAKAGDEEAFGELYLRHFDHVYGYLRVALRDPHEAEDAAQQVFLAALKAIAGYVPDRPFRAWLVTIVRNEAISRLRKSRLIAVTEPAKLDRRRETDEGDRADRSLEWISDRELLRLIERLPETQRQALVLRYLVDLDGPEIARVMGRSPDDVRTLHAAPIASSASVSERSRRFPPSSWRRRGGTAPDSIASRGCFAAARLSRSTRSSPFAAASSSPAPGPPTRSTPLSPARRPGEATSWRRAIRMTSSPSPTTFGRYGSAGSSASSTNSPPFWRLRTGA